MEFKKAIVVGAGTMGAGIAQIFAQGGIPVTLTDQSVDIVSKAVAGLEKRMARRVEQGKMSAGDKDEILSRISVGAGYGAASDADVVIEAVFEDGAAPAEEDAATVEPLADGHERAREPRGKDATEGSKEDIDAS